MIDNESNNMFLSLLPSPLVLTTRSESLAVLLVLIGRRGTVLHVSGFVGGGVHTPLRRIGDRL